MERIDFLQKHRLNLPLKVDVTCEHDLTLSEFNILLNPILIKRIELSSNSGFHLRADRTGNDGCYGANNPIVYWVIEKHKKWFSHGYAGEIATEMVSNRNIRIRIYVLEEFWQELKDAVNEIYQDIFDDANGFKPIIGRYDSSQEPVILFFTSSPRDYPDRIRTDRELRIINDVFISSPNPNKFTLKTCLATRPDDFQSNLLRYSPQIVHFSGHGTEGGEILVENEQEYGQIISPSGLAKLFEVIGENIKCVFLNACYSKSQAQMIAKHIEFVVGTSGQIEDDTALIFSKSFYEGLANGLDVQRAFELGKSAIMIIGLAGSDKFELFQRESPVC
jgi:hypothetical protein